MSSKSSFDDDDHRGALEILNSMRIDEELTCEDVDEMKKLKESFRKWDFSSPCDSTTDEEAKPNVFDGRKTIRPLTQVICNNDIPLVTTALAKNESFAKESESLKLKYMNSDRSGSDSEINKFSFEQSEDFFQIIGFEKSFVKNDCKKKQSNQNKVEASSNNEGELSLPIAGPRLTRESTLSEESTTSTVEIENDDRHFICNDNSIVDNCVVSLSANKSAHKSKFMHFIESERPEKVEYRNGRIIIPNTVDEDKLMVITKKDLKDFLQDNCIDTHVLLNEIRASNNILKMHFQESVGKAFDEINEQLKKITNQKNEFVDKHDQHLNAYINYSYEKILKDNQEMKKVMTDLIAFTNDGIVNRSNNVNSSIPNCVEEAEIDNEAFVGHKAFTNATDCVNEVTLEEYNNVTFTPKIIIDNETENEPEVHIKENSEQCQRIHSAPPPIVVGQRIFNLEVNKNPVNQLGCINEEVNSSYEQKESHEPPEVKKHHQ